MKRIIGLLALSFLPFTACNSNANDSTQKQNPKVNMKQLKIVRHFNVKPENVYKAFTNPQDMIVWWTPDTKFEIDLQVGGQYTITRKEEEMTFVMTGKYLEVNKPNKLVFTYAMPDLSPIIDTITIEIQPDGKGGSQMTFTQAGEGIDEELKQLPEGKVSESEKGWNLGFDLMEEHWKKTGNG